MNFQSYLKKLNSSKVFKEFMKKNKKAYACSGFFTIDKEGTDNQRHIDFYVPDKKQMFSFSIVNNEIQIIPVELTIEKVPKPLLIYDFDFEFEEVEKLVLNEMQNREIKTKLQKIIISLQNIDGKNILICTVFVSMLGLLKVHIGFDNKGNLKLILFEKKSFFDLMRRVK